MLQLSVNAMNLGERDEDNVTGPPSNEAKKNSTSDGPDFKKLPKVISFDNLARCGEELWIENNGEIYRLRRTRQGKLILTK